MIVGTREMYICFTADYILPRVSNLLLTASLLSLSIYFRNISLEAIDREIFKDK